ncbi:MAG: MotA/TolQ/ExbB proton channel family protein [Pseudomonadales bacterium]|nr:MotA/TolQ/ExbB proton channel family protein [Pseudomonadales bacterium]
MFSFLDSGGTFMYIILAVSVFALAMFLERAYFLYIRLNMNIELAYQRIIVALQNSGYRSALRECENITVHPLGRILKAGLLHAGKRDKEIEQALQESMLREMPLLKARINYLSMFANVATLLGLLGTIVGLIAAFEGVSSAVAAEKQAVLASGISVAMFTTAFGLIVSIPCLVGFYLLNNRGDHLLDQCEEKSLSLFNALTTKKRED